MPDPRDPKTPSAVGTGPLVRETSRPAPELPPPTERPLPASPPRVTGAPGHAPTTLPAPTREPALPDPSRLPAPAERRLPEHKGKVGRIGDALTGLSEDLKAWVELRVQLVQTEIMEQVEYRIGQAKMGAAAGLVAALGGFFLLVTLALLFGWLLFLTLDLSVILSAFLGFLIVTLFLFLGAFVLYRVLKPSPPPSARPDPSA